MASSRFSRLVLMVRGGGGGGGSSGTTGVGSSLCTTNGLTASVEFYHAAVGLPILRVTDHWAELLAGPGVTLTLQTMTAATNYGGNFSSSSSINNNMPMMMEAPLSTGYSPWLIFTVRDMDRRIAACIQAGAHLDGPIQYPAFGKMAVLRTPDQHMIGLYEPAYPDSGMDESDYITQ